MSMVSPWRISQRGFCDSAYRPGLKSWATDGGPLRDRSSRSSWVPQGLPSVARVFSPGHRLRDTSLQSSPPEDFLETPDSPAAAADVDGVFGLEPEIGAEFHQHFVSTLHRHHGGAGARADLHLGGVAAGEAAGRDFQHLELRIDRHRLLAEEL